MLHYLVCIGFFVLVSCAPGYENLDDKGKQGNNTSVSPDLARSELNITRRRRQYWHESFNEYDYRRQTFGDDAYNSPQDFGTLRGSRDAFYGSKESSYYDKSPPHFPPEPPPPPPHRHIPPPPPPPYRYPPPPPPPHEHHPPPPPPYGHHPPPPPPDHFTNHQPPHDHEPPPGPYDHHPPPPYHERGPLPPQPPPPHEHHPPPPPPYSHHPPPPPPDLFFPTPPYQEKTSGYEERQARQTTNYDRQYEPPRPPPYRPFFTQGRRSTSREDPPIDERGPPPPERGPPPRYFGRPPPPPDWGPPPRYPDRPPHGHRPPPRSDYDREPYREPFPPPPPRDNYYQPPSDGYDPWKNNNPPPRENFDKPHRPSRPSQERYELTTPERVTISLPTYDSNKARLSSGNNKQTGSLEEIITEIFKVKEIKKPETSNKNESSEEEEDSQSMIDIRFGDDPKASSRDNANVDRKTTLQKNENTSTSPNTFTLHYYQVTPVTPPN